MRLTLKISEMSMVPLGIAGGVVIQVVVAILLFASAGRLNLPMFWAYLLVWLALAFIGPMAMDPTLIKERFWPGPGERDYVKTMKSLPLALVQLIVAGLDVGRLHWTDTVPRSVQVAGLVAVAAALAVSVWASSVNRFFSSIIRIQTERGHHVITSGPYRLVRHPAYACGPFLVIGTGLALGSWLAALVGLALVFPILRRTAEEDRTLLQELEGYAAYAEKVRYRLFPGVW